MYKIQHALLTCLITFASLVKQADSQFLGIKSTFQSNKTSNSEGSDDRFFETLRQWGIKPWYLIVAFIIFVAFDILVCWAFVKCSRYLKRSKNQVGLDFESDVSSNTEVNINSEEYSDITEEQEGTLKYPPFLRSCPTFLMRK